MRIVLFRKYMKVHQSYISHFRHIIGTSHINSHHFLITFTKLRYGHLIKSWSELISHYLDFHYRFNYLSLIYDLFIKTNLSIEITTTCSVFMKLIVCLCRFAFSSEIKVFMDNFNISQLIYQRIVIYQTYTDIKFIYNNNFNFTLNELIK